MTLLEYRTAAKLTQQEVACVLCMSVPHYCSIERGRYKLLPKHADVLAWRFGWTEIGAMAYVKSTRGRPARRTEIAVSASNEAGTGVCLHDDTRAKAEILAMLGAVAWQGEIPHDWRNRWRHRDLWQKWLLGGMRTVRDMGVAI